MGKRSEDSEFQTALLEADNCRALWTAVLTTYANDIKNAQILGTVKKILWEIDEPWVDIICDNLSLDAERFRLGIERIAIQKLKHLVHTGMTDRAGIGSIVLRP